MAVLNESGIKEKLRTAPTGVYLICGEEDYLKKVYTDRLVAKTVEKDFADFNLHTFDGRDARITDIYDSVEALPMMSDTSCVLVNDMALDSLDADSLELLEKMLAEAPESCALIFCMQTVRTSGEKWKKITKMFDRYGFVVKLEKKETGDIVRMVEKGAQKRGAVLEPSVAAYLISCVGTDLNTVINETDKLCAYAANRRVTRADVDAVCIKSLEAKVFDILKALHSGRFDLAMNRLNTILAQREEPVMILGAFVSSYVDMYRVRAAVTAGKRAEDIGKYYNYAGKDFRLKNAAKTSTGLSLNALYECAEILARADDMLKGSDVNGALVLEQTLARLAVAEGNDR